MIISLIGAPGSGKGTYGLLLATRFRNSTFLSVGDILRTSAKHDHAMKEVLVSGSLADDTMVGDSVLGHLEKTDVSATNSNLILLDGFPRNKVQTTIQSKWPSHLQPKLALQFDIPDSISITKLLGRRKCSICGVGFNINGVDTDGFIMPPILPKEGDCKVCCNWETDWEKRDDDTAETIQKRMNVYHTETEPVLKYWRERDRLLRFVPYNGVKDMDMLVEVLETRLKGINNN